MGCVLSMDLRWTRLAGVGIAVCVNVVIIAYLVLDSELNIYNYISLIISVL